MLVDGALLAKGGGMSPRSALALASFAVALCAVHPCLGDEPDEEPSPAPEPLPELPAPSPVPPPAFESTPAPGGATTAPVVSPGTTSAPLPAPPALPAPSKTRRIRSPTWGRDTSLGAVAVGGGLIGAGWVLSVVHGFLGEVAGIDCQKSYGGYVSTFSCQDTDGYGPIYIPVAGPFLEAASHDGTLSDADKGFLAIEGLLQAGGAVTMLVGLASLPVTLSSKTASVTLTPAVTASGASLGLTGSF